MISWPKRFPVFWVILIVLLAGVAVFFIFRPNNDPREKPIPHEALSKIHQEKTKAQKEFAEFMQTPAGKIWEKHPYWDPVLCQKIAEGIVEPGMSKEQVRAALGDPKKIKAGKRGKILHEEWTMEGKERWILRFEENTLKTMEKKG